ncbi:jg22145 [Pararge aegeria aegeria]|uniref:Jg22145 protein n=1 Tax=Pararge aegeria aegeria TaxID=348720 RepID=A0A8S4QA08_9NEOP|nr:jg22145 [Pararge aegeria aegeria]
MKNFCIKSLKKLHVHLEERDSLVSDAIKNAQEATSDIEELTRYIECGLQGTKEEVETVKVLMKDYLQQIKAANIQYTWECDKSKVLDVQWQKASHNLINT